MSTKVFCDNCANEITNQNRAVFVKPNGGVVFTIASVGFNDLGRGDVCKYCVLDAIDRLDDRPRVVKTFDLAPPAPDTNSK